MTRPIRAAEPSGRRCPPGGSAAIGLLVVLLAAGAAAAQEATVAVPIVDRAIEHHGGRIYEHSSTELELCSKSGCADVAAWRRGGEFEYRVRGEVRDVLREVLVTNDRVELREDGVAVPVEPNREAGLRDWVMAKVYFPFLPYRLNDESVFKRDLGLEDWDGKSLHKVKVTFAAGSSTDADDEYLYWFDPESGRLVQFAYSYSGDPGGLRFRRGFDYRRVGGLLFFDQENFGLEGEGLTVDQITPELVATMPLVSTVTLSDIRVDAVR